MSFSDRSQHSLHLVVGADGIHSHVLQFAFGEERAFAEYLGYYAAFLAPNAG